MKFNVVTKEGSRQEEMVLKNLLVVGFAGKDIEKTMEHIHELEEAGMKVNVVDYEAFRNASKHAWDKFVEKYGTDLIERATGKPYTK